MSRLTIVSFISVCVLVSYVSADAEELKKTFMGYLMECTQENPISDADIAMMKQRTLSPAGKCLVACAYKKGGIIDGQGMLSLDGVNALNDKYLSGDADMRQKAKEFGEACKSVNDVAVTDGTAGCERAELIFKCSLEKAPLFKLTV